MQQVGGIKYAKCQHLFDSLFDLLESALLICPQSHKWPFYTEASGSVEGGVQMSSNSPGRPKILVAVLLQNKSLIFAVNLTKTLKSVLRGGFPHTYHTQVILEFFHRIP